MRFMENLLLSLLSWICGVIKGENFWMIATARVPSSLYKDGRGNMAEVRKAKWL